jgi:hypothetical protein
MEMKSKRLGQQRVVGLREKHRQKLNVYEHLYQNV